MKHHAETLDDLHQKAKRARMLKAKLVAERLNRLLPRFRRLTYLRVHARFLGLEGFHALFACRTFTTCRWLREVDLVGIASHFVLPVSEHYTGSTLCFSSDAGRKVAETAKDSDLALVMSDVLDHVGGLQYLYEEGEGFEDQCDLQMTLGDEVMWREPWLSVFKTVSDAIDFDAGEWEEDMEEDEGRLEALRAAAGMGALDRSLEGYQRFRHFTWARSTDDATFACYRLNALSAMTVIPSIITSLSYSVHRSIEGNDPLLRIILLIPSFTYLRHLSITEAADMSDWPSETVVRNVMALRRAVSRGPRCLPSSALSTNQRSLASVNGKLVMGGTLMALNFATYVSLIITSLKRLADLDVQFSDAR